MTNDNSSKYYKVDIFCQICPSIIGTIVSALVLSGNLLLILNHINIPLDLIGFIIGSVVCVHEILANVFGMILMCISLRIYVTKFLYYSVYTYAVYVILSFISIIWYIVFITIIHDENFTTTDDFIIAINIILAALTCTCGPFIFFGALHEQNKKMSKIRNSIKKSRKEVQVGIV